MLTFKHLHAGRAGAALGGLSLLLSGCGESPSLRAEHAELLRRELPVQHHAALSPDAEHCAQLYAPVQAQLDRLRSSRGWAAMAATPQYQKFVRLAADAPAYAPRHLAGGASETPTNPTPPNEEGFSTAPEGEKAGGASKTPTNPTQPNEEGFSTAPEGEKAGGASKTPTNPTQPNEEGFSTEKSLRADGNACDATALQQAHAALATTPALQALRRQAHFAELLRATEGLIAAGCSL